MSQAPLSHSNINLEQTHVEEVYEVIARHFSGTRYKPWPRIADFLSSFPPGSLVADVGCGNGKYTHVNEQIIMHGTDVYVMSFISFSNSLTIRSLNLLSIAQSRGLDCIQATNLRLPYKDSVMVFFSSRFIYHRFLSTPF